MVAASDFPRRYQPVRRLGKGGSGEVWEVRDRANGQALALKLLAPSADRGEILGLVREASALTGLEGLGLPRVLRYAVLKSTKQTFIVRELITGASLRDLLAQGGADPVALVRALGDAAVQLAEVHRAGLLHGDIKPGNVVVDDAGSGRLVDLGLSAPFLDAGTTALGLTPDYAAPELLTGKRMLTVRSEIYSLGASLAELLEPMPAGSIRDALYTVAKRATRHAPDERHPSVDEFARALSAALGKGAERNSELHGVRLWPVLGIEAFSRQLFDRVTALALGESLRLSGPPGSGRSTLLRRLAWTLGASGYEVAWLEAPDDALLDLELGNDLGENAFVLLDADESADFTARAIARAGTRRIVRVTRGDTPAEGTLLVPALDDASVERLVRLALPSLSAAAAGRIRERSGQRPGPLRTLAARLATHAVVSAEELEALLAAEPDAPAHATIEALEAAVLRGRFAEGRRLAAELAAGSTDRFEYHAALAKIATATGEFAGAEAALERAAKLADTEERTLVTRLLGARLALRRGDSERARSEAEAVARSARGDLASDAEAVAGMASVLLGDVARAGTALERAAKLADSARAKAIAKGSLAIAQERSGKDDAAKKTYAEALEWAERAEDAWTTTTTHTNFAGLLRKLGDLAGASRSLEAGIDMGQRAGATLLVELSRINLLSLDLYLGRYARAEELATTLGAQETSLSAVSRAQLLGLRAEHAERKAQFDEAISLYAACTKAYRALGRAADAAEIELTAMLVRARVAPRSGEHLAAYATLVGTGRPAWFDEHEALAAWVLGVLSLEAGQEPEAKAALDRAIDIAERQKQREVEWQAREWRARYYEQQGAVGMARKDLDAAVLLLEQTATALPRDLREVFWNDPRRRSLRVRSQAGHGDTMSVSVAESVLPKLPRARVDSASRHFAASLGADERLLRVLEITRELARERDLDRVLARVVEHAIALAQAERGAILLRGDDGTLAIHTSKNARGVEGDSRAFSRSVATLAMEQGEPVVTDSATSDPRFGGAQSVQASALQSVLCVPIHGAPPANQAIGALYLEAKRATPHEALELATITAFADQAAIAIDNARLWREAEVREDELSQQRAELEKAKSRLAEVLERRTEQLQTARKDLRQVRRGMEAHFGYQGLVGTSPAMKRVYSFIEQVKDTDIPVLILGESGTGKEVVARALHQASTRASAPFIGINCGAIPANLLESELFGHVRGAFTGADRERGGLLRDAKEGTVLLDEIGEMPLAMQAGILRVLQEKLVRPLGGTTELPVAARIIAATNRNLEEMVQERTFREDLYYRIHVATLVLPSLRDRREDIPMLVDHLLTRFAARYRRDKKPVEREALRALVEHPWPGNVRQLEHVLLSAWLMGDEDEIRLEDLGLSSSRGFGTPKSPSAPAARPKPRAESGDDERESILQALASEGGNRVKAAEALGMPRRTFYRRLKQYGLLD